MNYINNLKALQGVTIDTKYYIDFVCEYSSSKEVLRSYYQLVRTEDEEILYANEALEFVYAECFLRNIARRDVTLI